MTETTKTIPITPPLPKKRRGGGLFLFTLFLLTAFGAGYLVWQQVTRSQQQLQQQIDALKQQVITLQTEFQAILSDDNPDSEQSIEDLQTQLKTFSEQQRRLESTLTTLTTRVQQPRPREEDWILAETVYLLTLANYRLHFAQDPNLALTALLEADHNLQNLPVSTLSEVRNQLTKVIAEVREATRLDITSLAAQLANDIGTADQLPLLQGVEQNRESSKPAVSETTAPLLSSEQNLAAFLWQQLQQLVVIRYNTEADVGLLSMEQRHFIMESLRFKLEMARYALLHRDTQNFALTLQTIRDWLDAYYDTHHPEVKAWLQQLANLQQLNLTPTLPQLSPLIDTLRAALAMAPVTTTPVAAPPTTPPQETTITQ